MARCFLFWPVPSVSIWVKRNVVVCIQRLVELFIVECIRLVCALCSISNSAAISPPNCVCVGAFCVPVAALHNEELDSVELQHDGLVNTHAHVYGKLSTKLVFGTSEPSFLFLRKPSTVPQCFYSISSYRHIELTTFSLLLVCVLSVC